MQQDIRDFFSQQDQRLIDAAKTVATAVQAVPTTTIPPRALLVGGFVRDLLFGLQPKDLDMEVFGVSPEQLESLLETLFPGCVKTVGKSFGILKVHLASDLEFDVSLPRRESKTGKGHRGFFIESDPSMTIEDAAKRRDFTINAISGDPLTGELLDPTNGLTDLESRTLRFTDAVHFQEDPLRVYRALQFSARLNLTVDDATMKLMRDMVLRGDLAELSKERVTDEIKKLLLRASTPSVGLHLARALGILEQEYPELHALIETPQEPEWHPEGDVWVHTMDVVNEAAKIIRQSDRDFQETDALAVMIGALCHDLGKPSTTQHLNGRVRSIGHEEAGAAPTQRFCERFTFGDSVNTAAIHIAKHHLKPSMLFRSLEKGELSHAQYVNAVRKLVKRVQPTSWQVLIAVAEADFRGRGVPGCKTEPYLMGDAFRQAIAELEAVAEPTRPLLEGRDLLPLGVQPGPLMGRIIDEVEDARDAGRITTKDQAISFAKEIIERP